MNNRTTKIVRAALAGLALLLTANVSAATITWTITMTPAGGGTIDWATLHCHPYAKGDKLMVLSAVKEGRLLDQAEEYTA